jgi:hypothetical protein
MKKSVCTSVLGLLFLFSVISCGSKKAADDKSASTPDAATPASTDAPADKKGMSVSEAVAFLNADEANSGKEVTVSAYSWGHNERMDEKIQLNLGDKKLEGLQAANFACLFGKDQSAAIKAIAKDAMVTVTGKISKGAGAVELNECKIVQ